MKLICELFIVLVHLSQLCGARGFSQPLHYQTSGNARPIASRHRDSRGHPLPFDSKYPIDRRSESDRDVIARYTANMPSSALVAAAATLSVMTMLSLASNIIAGRLYHRAAAIVSLVLGVMSFCAGHVGDFSRAAGVMLILLISKISLGEFLLKLVHLIRSAIGLSARRPFPPALNPWTYTPSSTDRKSEIGFRMRNALLGLATMGLFFGYSVCSYIPLLPTSIGALSAAVLAAYIGTYRDGLGDLFRFFGSTFIAILSNTYSSANEVGFTTKLNALFGQLMVLYSMLDHQFGLNALLSSVLERIYSIFSIILSRFQDSGSADIDLPYREEEVRYSHMHPPGRHISRQDYKESFVQKYY